METAEGGKITSLLILSALILSTVTATAAGASIGILQSMRVRQAEGLNGNRYATFHQLTEEQMLRLSENSRLTDVGSILQLGNTRLGSSSLTLFYGNTAEMPWLPIPPSAESKKDSFLPAPEKSPFPRIYCSILAPGKSRGTPSPCLYPSV